MKKFVMKLLDNSLFWGIYYGGGAGFEIKIGK